MIPIKNIVQELLYEIKAQHDHAQALPDMAISLLESSIEENIFPEPSVLENIGRLILQDGFPKDKYEKIEKLLIQIRELKKGMAA